MVTTPSMCSNTRHDDGQRHPPTSREHLPFDMHHDPERKPQRREQCAPHLLRRRLRRIAHRAQRTCSPPPESLYGQDARPLGHSDCCAIAVSWRHPCVGRWRIGLRQMRGRFSILAVIDNMALDSPDTPLTLLKPSDVAAHLGVSRSWLYDAAKAGRIPSIRVGGPEGPLRFVPDDLREWVDDARARWLPGRPTVPTRSPYEQSRPRRGKPRTPMRPSGQQSLL